MKEKAIKEIYYKVLEELLLEKDFLEIKTTEIIDRSGLSRATFYKYFRDKYELAAWEFGMLFAHTLPPHEYKSPNVLKDSLRSHIQYIYDHKAIFKNLFGYSGQNSFENYYMEFPKQVVTKIARHSGRTLSQRDLYQIQYHAGAAALIIKDWILTGATMSVEEIFDIICENLNDSVIRLYQVEQEI